MKILRYWALALMASAALLPIWSLTALGQTYTNYVLALDGIKGCVNVPSTAELQNADAFTLEAWVYPQDKPTGMTFISKSDGLDGTSQRSYELKRLTNGVTRFAVYFQLPVGPNQPAFAEVEAYAPPEQWTHLTAVFDRWSGMGLYTNGELASFATNYSGSASFIGLRMRQTSRPLTIGGMPGFPTSFTKGYMNDVRVWTIARAAQQISEYYLLPSAREFGLAGYWNWDTQTPVDRSIFENNGILTTGASIVPTVTSPVVPYFQIHPATGTAQVVNGFVVGVALTDSGWGYTNVPPVHFLGGGGSGAAGIATVQGGVVTGVTITATGSGYTSVPRVLIAAPPGLPSLGITVKQVQVNLNLILGYTYKIQTSTDLQIWIDTGSPFLATESTMTQTFEVTNGQQMFRVIQVP